MKSLRVALVACAALLAIAAAGCGSNRTAIAITVIDPTQTGATSVSFLENSTHLLAASVTGTSTNTVNWFICLPSTVVNAKPTDCTPTLTGYGTITQTGVYTAPAVKPSPNTFLIMATSTVDPAAFGSLAVQITSGITVTFSTPSTISMATQETYQLAATVRGTTNTALVWAVNGAANGDPTDGTISSTGLYTAPAISPGSVTVTATSAVDSSASATATINLTSLADPDVASIEPPAVSAGSAQQILFVTGSNFLNTSSVAVPIAGILTRVPTNFVSGTTLEATLPASALQSPGNLVIQVQAQNNNLSTTSGNLVINAIRPALLGMTPEAVSQSAGGAGLTLNLAGGFFTAGTTASFNGSSVGLTTSLTSSRQLSIGVPAGAAANPGLYAVIVQNSAAASAGVPSRAGLNLTVTPNPGSIPGAAIATVAVGANPSSVAIDRADGAAVVANKNTGTNADGTVSVISLATNAVVSTFPTNGNNPTGVAVDDLLPAPLALVVNSTDQTVSGINLTTGAVSTISVSIGTNANGTPILPYSIGVNPLTHRAIVAYQNSNQATIIDTSSGAPVAVGKPGSVGGTLTPYSTGFTPSVAVDSHMNWAVITPGGAGSVNIVDLGRTATVGGLPLRNPAVVAVLSVASSLTVQGAGINPLNHQVLFTDSSPGGTNQDTDLTAFSLLNQSVQPITFTSGGQAFTEAGFVASAINPLTGVGIAVNQPSNIAAVVDMQTGNVLAPSIPVGTSPVAVAVDPASDEAVVANGDGTASVLSLGPAANPLQIVETSPDMTLTSASPLSLSILGSGFNGTSQVLLDGAPVTVTSVSANGREIVASVPAGGAANLLGAARRFLVQVQNGTAVSNLSDLSLIQAIPVGKSPVGVAVDPDRDLALVTNSGDNTVSLVALTTAQTGAVGTLATQPVGANPQGVAIYPLAGLAVVANHDSNSVSIVDDNFISGSQLAGPYDVPLCGVSPGVPSGCSGPTGVAVDGLNGAAVVTNSTSNNVSFINLPPDTSTTATLGSSPAVDAFPNAVAIDPDPNVGLAAVAAASPTSAQGASSLIDFVSIGSAVAPPRDPGFQLPTGIAFDPLSRMFLVANSLQNQVVIVDPTTGINTPVGVGINPTSIDYNYQTSTLVTANTASNTVSVIEYMCAPNGSGAFVSCPAPQVRSILPLAGSQQFSIAVDSRLNLAVLADQQDNQVLLVPLPY